MSKQTETLDQSILDRTAIGAVYVSELIHALHLLFTKNSKLQAATVSEEEIRRRFFVLENTDGFNEQDLCIKF
jgi:hypothetical protein